VKRTILVSLLLVTLGGSLSIAQERSFGKNKVQYKKYDWQYIQTRHFDVYFYENAYATAKFTADVMEDAYIEISRELDYKIQRRVPIFVYNSQNDFQQTNITPELLPEGVGGFTEAFKSRIVIPFTGSYEEFRHVLHHELTHAVVYDILFGNSFASLLSRQRLFDLPLWYAEGYAEFSSRHGWDYWSDMFVRDATINGYLAPPDYLGGFLAYKQGQAMVKYIVDKYGEAKLGEILQKGKIHLTMNRALKSAIGIEPKQFYEEFAKEMKRRYWPEISARKEAPDIGKQLTHARKDGSYFNERPAYSPEGDKVAIFSDRHDYDEIILLSASTGQELSRIVKAQRSGDLESLHSYFSGMSFSPDGKLLAFVAKTKGKDAIYLADVKRKKIVKRINLDFYNVLSPTFAPDGDNIVFSALAHDMRDLYTYTLSTGGIRKLTDDKFDDAEPSWLPDSKMLVFASDRPHTARSGITNLGQAANDSTIPTPGGFDYGVYNIFKLDLATLVVSPVDVGSGSNRSPVISPNGKMVAFVSNRNGIDNVYLGYIDSVKYYAVTDVLTGIRDLSWSPDGQKLAFSAFHNGGFDIFVMKDFVPVGENGVLKPTDFMLGKYNDPFKKTGAKDAIARAGDSVLKAHQKLAGLPGDSMATGSSDSTSNEVTKKDTVITQTGIQGEDFVYVSGHSVDPMDSLLRPVSRDSTGPFKPLSEPASFDSIPPPSETGEYEVHKYKVKFTPDYVGGGFAYDTFFGVRGQSVFVFSDYLGNHQILIATDLVNTIDQSYVQAFYVNNASRVHFGGGFFHTKNYYENADNHLFSDRYYGVAGFAEHPFSIFSRVDGTLSQIFIDRKYYDFDDTTSDRSTKITYSAVSYVFDNVLWGWTGPVNGKRYKLTLDAGINLFDSKDISFHSLDLDYRRYWNIKKSVSFGFRVSGGASFGRTPKTYFVGGVSNWIGSRRLSAPVYEVKNLYFADVIVPLRGQPIYGLAGSRYGVINAELRFPLVQVLALKYPLPLVFQNIQGAIFTDIGAAWTGSRFKGGTAEGGNKRLQDIRAGFGCGMRLNFAGLALLRYDVAWSTDLDKVSDRPTHYFSLGADF
jgi:WD40 repeat protein